MLPTGRPPGASAHAQSRQRRDAGRSGWAARKRVLVGRGRLRACAERSARSSAELKGAVRCGAPRWVRGRGVAAGCGVGGVSLPPCADRRHGHTERGDAGGAWCLGRSRLGGSGGWCSGGWCVTRARVSDPFGQAGPSSAVAASSLGFCRGKELPLCQPPLGALSVSAE